MANVNELLDGHVTLEVECIDRMYLNGYVGNLATGGQLKWFLNQQMKKPYASPALLGQMREDFVGRLKEYAEQRSIPLVHFKHGEDKEEMAKRLRQKRGVRDEVVFIGVAQEKAVTFTGKKVEGEFQFNRDRDKPVYVNYYYNYLDDDDFGPAFLKICSYAPWSIKLCLNGHEWAKRQLERRKIGYAALDNGFQSCEAPEKLQQICDSLGPEQIDRFFRKWLGRLPLPLRRQDREAGYDYQLSIWQLEVSLTQVFDRPVRGREFFEEIMRDNIDLGRPDRVQLIFGRRVTKQTPGLFRTRVIQDGVNPSLHIEYKHIVLKQYFKEGRAGRTETTIGNTGDLGVNRGLSNLPYLQKLGRQINRRLLEVERVSHNCGLGGDSIQRVVQPTVNADGQKAPGLRFGQPRVMALWVALTMFQHLINGFHNRDLRQHVADLLGLDLHSYSANQMTYDLRRLLRKGIIFRAEGTNRYFLTPFGWKVARLFARLESRVFRPAVAAFGTGPTGLPPPLLAALNNLDAQFDTLIANAVPLKKAS
jgi:hypothetical protein